MLYLVIPNTDIQLYSGCVVIFNKYPDIRWVLHYGWCKYEETEIFGWYFKSIPTNITIPAGRVDLSDLKIIDNPCPPTPPSPSEDQVPFTEELRDMVYASFITVQSLDELNTIDTSVVPDGKLVRVNNVDGSVVYYVWSLDQHEWVVADYVSVEEFNLLAEEVSRKQDELTAGENIQIQNNVISATDTTYENLPAEENGQDVSLVTTGEKYTWDNKSDFSGSYNDLTDKPEINDATLTIQANGSTLGTFTANSDTDVTVNITAEDLGITAPMDFVGVSTTDPQGEHGATVSGHTTWLSGEVVIYQKPGESGYAEYVNIDGNNTSASWELLGDAESYALKSVQIDAGTGLTGGGDLSQNRTLSLADAYGDTKNPYGIKSASNVLIAPGGVGGLPTFRALTKSDLPPVLTVSDITAISSADLEKLTIGDTVIQNTANAIDVLYVVSYATSSQRRLVNTSPSQITSVNYSKVFDWEYQGTTVFDVSTKQDTLVSGTNIRTINGNDILGAGDVAINTYQPFPNTWTTNSTTIAFCSDVYEDTSAVGGMAYLGGLNCSDLPFNGNGDAIVEIMEGTAGKVVHIILSSGTDYPYHWEYTYWRTSGTAHHKGWIGFQPEITISNQLSSDYVTDTDKSHKFVTQEMYEYLEDVTYKLPSIDLLSIYNSSNAQLASSYETGSTIELGKAIHRESNISNISGNLTLKHKLGSSSEVIVSSAVAPSTTNSEVAMSGTLALASAGTLVFTLSGTNTRNEAFNRTASVSIYNYAYTTTTNSVTTPTTGLTRQSVASTFASSGASIQYSAGDYLYFYVLSSGKFIYQYVAGQWVKLDAGVELGLTAITKSNGATSNYYAYRFGPMSGAGKDTFRVSD